MPSVSFLAASSLTDESLAIPEVRVLLSEPATSPARVSFDVVRTSAMSGSDYIVRSNVVEFEPPMQEAVVALEIIDDQLEEDEEFIQLRLKDPQNLVIGDTPEHELRIAANKLARVYFTATASAAQEPGGAQSFEVRLDRATTDEVVVSYFLTGSAEPADYSLQAGTLRIPPGQVSAALATAITNDPTDELDETLEVTLVAQAGAVVSPGLGRRVHTILDEDPEPAIDFALAASNLSEAGGTAQLQVRLALASEKPITIDYGEAAGGSAAPGDFSLPPGTLTFAPGAVALAVPVDVTNDPLDEPDETVRVALGNPTNARLVGTLVHALTITDDDAAPQLAFAQGTSAAAEGAGTHAITVQLSAPSGRDVQFSIARTGAAGTADVTIGGGPYTIPAGATQATIEAAIASDALDEDDETVTLSLTNLVNASAGTPPSHALTITDDDDPPLVRFDPAVGDRSAAEGNGADTVYTYPVVLSAPSGRTVSVSVARTGTAQSSDFSIPASDLALVFQPGETSKAIRLTIRAGTADEPDETVILTLGAPTNGTSAPDNQSRTHTILDDDAP